MYSAMVGLVCGMCFCVMCVWLVCVWVACVLEVIEIVVVMFARDEV